MRNYQSCHLVRVRGRVGVRVGVRVSVRVGVGVGVGVRVRVSSLATLIAAWSMPSGTVCWSCRGGGSAER